MRKSKCEIDNCNNKIKHKRAGLCNNCYSALYYWQKKTPSEVMQRRKKLKVFTSRLDAIASTRGKR